MLHKVIRAPAAPKLFDPARDAARLLGWVGVSVLMIGAPLVGVLSRRSLFILLPIGASLLVAAFSIRMSSHGLKTFRDAMRRPVGLAAGCLCGWAVLSLFWTPFPGQIAPELIACLATGIIAALMIAHIPERRAANALYLLPGGVAVTALTTLAMALFGPASFRGGSEFDPSLLERSVLTLVVLVWPALGALATLARWRLAIGLAILVAATITAAGASIAMAVFILGSVAFNGAVDHPERTARRAALVFGTLFVAAPLIPFVLAPLAAAIPMVGRSTVLAMADWRTLILEDGVRMVTGHGIGTAAQGVIGGWLPSHTPKTLLFEVWYELGLLGALSLAAVVVLGLISGGRTVDHAAPALMGGMIATLAIAVFGVATAQIWFVTLASLQALAFGLVCRASRSGDRPSATEVERLPEVSLRTTKTVGLGAAPGNVFEEARTSLQPTTNPSASPPRR